MVSMNGNGSGQPSKRRVTGKQVLPLGMVIVTGEAADYCEEHGYHPLLLVARFGSGDWGDVKDWVVKRNEEMLKKGGPNIGAYKVGEKHIMIGYDPRVETTRVDFLPDDLKYITT